MITEAQNGIVVIARTASGAWRTWRSRPPHRAKPLDRHAAEGRLAMTVYQIVTH